MALSIDVRGVAEVQAFLARIDEGQKATLQKASTAGARALKPFVKAAAPRGATGRLARSISGRQAARDRPAAVVTARPKVAFYRHMVLDGTKDHGPKKASVMVFKGDHGTVFTRHVRGTKPRPFMAEGFAAGEAAMNAAIDKVIDEALKG